MCWIRRQFSRFSVEPFPLFIAVSLLFLCGPVLADEPLSPADLLLVFNGQEPASRIMAEHYAEVRGVPQDRLCQLDVPGQFEDITFQRFEQLIRQPVRDYLQKHKLTDKVRCLVTFYGLPIRIGPRRITTMEQQLATRWRDEYIEGYNTLREIVHELTLLGGGGPTSRPMTTKPSEADLAPLVQEYSRFRKLAFQKVDQRKQQENGIADYQRLVTLLEQGEGVARLLSQLGPATGHDQEAARQRLGMVQNGIREALTDADKVMAGKINDSARDRARAVIRRHLGLIGYLNTLVADLALCEVKETEAAVDSELMLLWWEQYPRYRWIPNLLNWRVRHDLNSGIYIPAASRGKPVLMVSRIDGPDTTIAGRLVDIAMAVERKGMEGNVCIDARGLGKDEGYGQYDADLRELAEMLWRYTPLEVRLDNRASLLAPGECPSAILYCGWYSVRQYVDSCTFVPGAVAYHVASFEAASLKRPGESGWCRNLLSRGVAATLGPVAEPYLQSFPKPGDFFGLLLTGRFSLAECYAYSIPSTSWRMMLIGDPLYRPFGNRPLLKIEQVMPVEIISPVPASQPE